MAGRDSRFLSRANQRSTAAVTRYRDKFVHRLQAPNTLLARMFYNIWDYSLCYFCVPRLTNRRTGLL